MTLIELVIVVAVMSILLSIAVPGYSNYMLRVHRSEAVRLLLQASMCQERLYAANGNYDTASCQPSSAQQRYQISYANANSQQQNYIAYATPKNAQTSDPCGSLSLDQSGLRGVSAANASVTKCWSGR